jgi:hypothetical protein
MYSSMHVQKVTVCCSLLLDNCMQQIECHMVSRYLRKTVAYLIMMRCMFSYELGRMLDVAPYIRTTYIAIPWLGPYLRRPVTTE